MVTITSRSKEKYEGEKTTVISLYFFFGEIILSKSIFTVGSIVRFFFCSRWVQQKGNAEGVPAVGSVFLRLFFRTCYGLCDARFGSFHFGFIFFRCLLGIHLCGARAKQEAYV